MINGNQAIKIPSGTLSYEENTEIMDNKEMYVSKHMMHECEDKIKKLFTARNIDILEYNALFNQHCLQYEQMYLRSMRKRFRMKELNDQIKEFAMPKGEVYHPYNPYLQKYHGEYLRTYQQF